MGRNKSKKGQKSQAQDDNDSEDGTVAQTVPDLQQNVEDVIIDALDQLGEKKTNTKLDNVNSIIKSLQTYYLGEEIANMGILDTVSRCAKKVNQELIVRVTLLHFLQNPTVECQTYLQKFNCTASLRGQAFICTVLDVPPEQILTQQIIRSLDQEEGVDLLNVLEAVGLLLCHGSALNLKERDYDQLLGSMQLLIQSNDSKVRLVAAKLAACIDNLDLEDEDSWADCHESVRSSCTTESIELMMEENFNCKTRSVKRIHKKDRAQNKKAHQQYLNIIKGDQYNEQTHTHKYQGWVATYTVDSLRQQIVIETIKFILGQGFNYHLFENEFVCDIVGASVEEEEWQSKRDKNLMRRENAKDNHMSKRKARQDKQLDLAY